MYRYDQTRFPVKATACDRVSEPFVRVAEAWPRKVETHAQVRYESHTREAWSGTW